MNRFKINLLIFVLFFVITYPGYAALLHPGMLTSHDGEGHIIRMFEFNKALNDGNFPVRWSKRLNWGLGYPYFNFNYPLTYYLTYILSKLGLDLPTTFKLLLLLSFPLGGFFTFLWLKQHFPKIVSLIGGLFYTLIPYHFLNVYVRGNLAEVLAQTLVPLGFYLVNLLYQKTNLTMSLWLSLSLAAVILLHNITALLFLPIIFLYGILLGLERGFVKFLIISYVFSFLITCFFWLPAIYAKQFITIDLTFPLYYPKNFPTLNELIYSPWGFGGSKVGVGQMSSQIGLVHLLMFVVSAAMGILGFKQLTQKKLSVFFLGLSGIAFLMMLSFSKPVWDIAKPLQYLQFPWRLLSVLSLTISFLAAGVIASLSGFLPARREKWLLIVFLAALLFFNRNHWRANEYYDLPEYWFNDAPAATTTTVNGEHTPKWQLEDRPSEKSRFEVLSGDVKVQSLTWRTNFHAFEINAKSGSIVLDRTVYFPGWTIFVDGKFTPRLDQNNPKTKGLIGFEVSRGSHLTEVKLLEPALFKVADAITLISLIFVVGYLLKIWKLSVRI